MAKCVNLFKHNGVGPMIFNFLIVQVHFFLGGGGIEFHCAFSISCQISTNYVIIIV